MQVVKVAVEVVQVVVEVKVEVVVVVVLIRVKVVKLKVVPDANKRSSSALGATAEVA